MILDYIWLNDETSILEQVQGKFNSAAIVTNPFIQMPRGWTHRTKKNNLEHIYPTNKEIFDLSRPVSWSQMIKSVGLNDLSSLALAMKTCIGALKEKYARRDLADKLVNNMNEDMYFPNEDHISHYFLPDIVSYFRSNGDKVIYFSEPIFDARGELNADNITSLELSDLAPTEIIITNKTNSIAFMSVYDSFITLLLHKENDISEVINKLGWEAITCSRDTKINWYLKDI